MGLEFGLLHNEFFVFLEQFDVLFGDPTMSFVVLPFPVQESSALHRSGSRAGVDDVSHFVLGRNLFPLRVYGLLFWNRIIFFLECESILNLKLS